MRPNWSGLSRLEKWWDTGQVTGAEYQMPSAKCQVLSAESPAPALPSTFDTNAISLTAIYC
jgi:hypothetical protein